MTERKFTDDMGEISGMGGPYEAACRGMLMRGVDWLDNHPDADLQGHTYNNVYGVATMDSDDAKELSEVVCDGMDGIHAPTGAMHQCVMSHLFWIKKNGWDEYCKVKRHTHTQALMDEALQA